MGTTRPTVFTKSDITTMKFKTIPVTAFQQNCSLIWCEDTNEAALIDPGGDIQKLLAVVEEENVELTKILLTHGHMDHVGGTAELKSQFALPIIGPHIGDKFWIDGLPTQAQMMGFAPVETFQPDHWLVEGETVSVGNIELAVLHCPGHTPGHVVFYHEPSKLAFVGDVLFQGSIGRTDFPQGDYEQLVGSIREKLWPLGDEVTFIPGHGPNSKFGIERQTNPFVADSRFG